MQGERVDLSSTLDDQLNDTPLDTLRYFNRCRLKSAFDSIFQKYGRDFEESDVVDISTGEVIEDKGFLKKTPQKKLGSLFKPKDEKSPFTADMISLLEPTTSSSTEEESSKETPTKTRSEKEIYDEEDFESILAQEKPRLSRNFPPFFPLPSLSYQQTPLLPSPLNPLFDASKNSASFNDTRPTTPSQVKIVSPTTKPLPSTTELANSFAINVPLEEASLLSTNAPLDVPESKQTPENTSSLVPIQELISPSLSYTPTSTQQLDSYDLPHTPTVGKRKWENDGSSEANSESREMKISRITPKDSPFEIEVLVEKKSQELLDTFIVNLEHGIEELSPGSYVSAKVADLISIKQAASRANTPTSMMGYEEKQPEGSQDDESQSIVYEYLETSRDYSDHEDDGSHDDVTLLSTPHTLPSSGKEQTTVSSTEIKSTTESNECKGYGRCTKAFCFDCALAEAENGLI